MRIPLKKIITVMTALAFGIALIGTYRAGVAQDSGNTLKVYFLDVGQGDAIYIRAPNGNDVLIDGGRNKSVIEKLRQVMPLFDTDIDIMIATHPDADHTSGLKNVFETYQVRTFIRSEISSNTQTYRRVLELAAEEPGLETMIARSGQHIVLDEAYDVYLEILYPDRDTTDVKNPNDASIVARLVYGNESFLLTGDSPISVEQFLIKTDPENLPATVLKLGHHGSKTSTSEAYLDIVKPDYAIVSAGANNSYNHPASDVIDRVLARNIKILSTIDLGTIGFETDGQTIWVK